MAPRTHIVGAGIAGLAAAVSLARAGRAVALYEASGAAGGRCRSYLDARLGCTLDNGNHLLLSGNRAALRYLAEIGAGDALIGPDAAAFPFLDLDDGRRWCLRPGAGRAAMDGSSTRAGACPAPGAGDYLSVLRLAVAGADRTVADCVGEDGALFRRFWEPLAVAALNTPARAGAARLLWAVLRETFARGEAACRPRIARTGLSHAFVDPALALLRRRGAAISFRHRLRNLAFADGRVHRLDFGAHTVALRDGDSVVLALPPPAAARMVPGLTVPEGSHAIVNAHFRLSAPAPLPAELPLLGLVGGTAQWLFVRGEIASVTVSAADALADEASEAIARKTWRDVARALALDPDPLPPYSIVKEKRATFAQTAGAGAAPAAGPDRFRQPLLGRRLDRYRRSGDDRGCRAFRPHGGRRHRRRRSGSRMTEAARGRGRDRRPEPGILVVLREPSRTTHMGIDGRRATVAAVVGRSGPDRLADRPRQAAGLLRRRGQGGRHRRTGPAALRHAGLCAPRDRPQQARRRPPARDGGAFRRADRGHPAGRRRRVQRSRACRGRSRTKRRPGSCG